MPSRTRSAPDPISEFIRLIGDPKNLAREKSDLDSRVERAQQAESAAHEAAKGLDERSVDLDAKAAALSDLEKSLNTRIDGLEKAELHIDRMIENAFQFGEGAC